MAQRILPDADVLLKLDRTMTRRQIASTFGVSPAAVTQAMQRAHVAPSDSPVGGVMYQGLLPWVIEQEHQQSWAANMLRALFAMEQGLEISASRTALAEGFRRNLDRNREVIAYNPRDGFFPVTRKGGEKLVRKPPQGGAYSWPEPTEEWPRLDEEYGRG